MFRVDANRLSVGAFVWWGSGCSCSMGVANWSGFCSQRHQSAQPEYHSYMCVSLSSSGFRQSHWTQPQPSKELREQLWVWTAISFLPMFPVSGFLFLSVFWPLYSPWTQHGANTQPHFHFSLISSSIFIYQLIWILYRHICFFYIDPFTSDPCPYIFQKPVYQPAINLVGAFFFLWAKTQTVSHLRAM